MSHGTTTIAANAEAARATWKPRTEAGFKKFAKQTPANDFMTIIPGTLHEVVAKNDTTIASKKVAVVEEVVTIETTRTNGTVELTKTSMATTSFLSDKAISTKHIDSTSHEVPGGIETSYVRMIPVTTIRVADGFKVVGAKDLKKVVVPVCSCNTTTTALGRRRVSIRTNTVTMITLYTDETGSFRTATSGTFLTRGHWA